MRSKPAEGATFIVRLPVPPTEAAALAESGLADGTSFPTAWPARTPPGDGAPSSVRPERKSKHDKKRRAS